MKLEIGKYYRTRDGRKVGPIRDTGRTYAFHRFSDGEFGWGVSGGALSSGKECANDLIAEWHDEPQPASPVRTVTRKEIVPGVYGKVYVKQEGQNAVDIGFVHADGSIGCPPLTKDEITAAIETLTAIKEAME